MINVRVSDAEHRKLVRESDKADVASLSAYLRLKLLSTGPIRPVASEIR